ncbi:MAG: hypothetical protein HQL48_04240 [Gammaproteobacteria bacterium]|nr:hypothetical protein [Gammaproteobacteria bacterium]
MQIVATLRDWSRNKVKPGGNYPAAQVVTLDIPVWPEKQAEGYGFYCTSKRNRESYRPATVRSGGRNRQPETMGGSHVQHPTPSSA